MASWYAWVYSLAGAPLLPLGALMATPISCMGPVQPLLRPDDLHGLPKGKLQIGVW